MSIGLNQSIFPSKYHLTWPLQYKIVFQTTFLQSVWSRNAFLPRKTQKTAKRNFLELYSRTEKMFIFNFLRFPAEQRISWQNTLKKSCSAYDFTSNWSHRTLFEQKKKINRTTLINIYWPFAKNTHRIYSVLGWTRFVGVKPCQMSPIRWVCIDF